MSLYHYLITQKSFPATLKKHYRRRNYFPQSTSIKLKRTTWNTDKTSSHNQQRLTFERVLQTSSSTFVACKSQSKFKYNSCTKQGIWKICKQQKLQII